MGCLQSTPAAPASSIGAAQQITVSSAPVMVDSGPMKSVQEPQPAAAQVLVQPAPPPSPQPPSVPPNTRTSPRHAKQPLAAQAAPDVAADQGSNVSTSAKDTVSALYQGPALAPLATTMTANGSSNLVSSVPEQELGSSLSASSSNDAVSPLARPLPVSTMHIDRPPMLGSSSPGHPTGSMERRTSGRFDSLPAGESQRRASMTLLSNDPEALAKQLLKASRAGMIGVVEAALDLAPNQLELVDFADSDYDTALHKAASQGHTDVVELLLGVGASPQTQNKDGRTPVMVAAEGGHREVCRVLVAHKGAARYIPPRVLYTIGNAHSAKITAVALSRDGRRMLTASQDETLRLWHAASAQQVALVGKHKSFVTCCAFMQHAPGAVSSCSDNTVALWDLYNLSPTEVAQQLPGANPRVQLPVLLSLAGHTESVHSLALSPSGGLLTASGDGSVKCWDISKPPQHRSEVKLVYNLIGHGGAVRTVAVSADGQMAASGSDDRLVRVWDLRVGSCVHTMSGHTGPVTCCTFSSDGRRLLSASMDHSVIIWDVRSGLQRHVMKGHTAAVTQVVVSADSSVAYSASLDTTIRAWDLVKGRELVCLRGHRLQLEALALSPDSHTLVMGSEHILKAIQLQVLPGLMPWHEPQLAHLVTAIEQGNVRLVLMILSTGINPEADDAVSGGWAGLMALAAGHPEVAELLAWWQDAAKSEAAAAATASPLTMAVPTLAACPAPAGAVGTTDGMSPNDGGAHAHAI